MHAHSPMILPSDKLSDADCLSLLMSGLDALLESPQQAQLISLMQHNTSLWQHGVVSSFLVVMVLPPRGKWHTPAREVQLSFQNSRERNRVAFYWQRHYRISLEKGSVPIVLVFLVIVLVVQSALRGFSHGVTSILLRPQLVGRRPRRGSA